MATKKTGGKEPEDGRDASGRFVKGWKGGPGNREFARLREYRAAVEKEIPAKTCSRILARFAVLAMKGDVAAGKVVLERLMGKPQTPISQSAPLDITPPANPEEAAEALRVIQAAFAAGDIGETQAATHLAILRASTELFDLRAVLDRIKALEARLGDEGEP